MSAWIEPRATARSTPFTATKPWKSFFRPRVSRIVPPGTCAGILARKRAVRPRLTARVGSDVIPGPVQEESHHHATRITRKERQHDGKKAVEERDDPPDLREARRR